MKKGLLSLLLFVVAHTCFSQAYISMPADSAVWRYRMYNIDYIEQVMDCIMFVNGSDTLVNGKTYHKIISRGYNRTVPYGTTPPVITAYANIPDSYYGAIRDSAKQVFLLTISGEQLIFDFNAVVGDSIPAYSGKVKVVAIDSVSLGGVYHKRFFTTDTTYYVIEGVGSNRGLIPGLNDGGGSVQFFCFSDTSVVYYPDTSTVCTYVYPIWYTSVPGIFNNKKPEVSISPMPAFDMVHISTTAGNPVHIVIYNCIGQAVWKGDVMQQLDIQVGAWAKGMYYIQYKNPEIEMSIKKLVVE